MSAGQTLLSLDGIPLEKQGLADKRRNGRRLVRFGDQECRLRALACEKAFRISRNEDHRYFEEIEQIVDGLQARASIGELNIRENEPRAFCFRQRDRLGPRSGNADGPVTETFDEILEIECDQNLVLIPAARIRNDRAWS